MPVAAGDIWQMTIQLTNLGQVFENVINMRDRGSSPSTDAAIKGAAQAFWHRYRDMISHRLTCQAIILKRMTPVAFDTIITAPASGDEFGAVSDDPCNSTLAGVVTLRTGVAGKTHRGRVYVPGIVVGALTSYENVINAGPHTTYQAVWDGIMTEFNDATGTSLVFALGIYSRLIGGTSPYTVAGWQAVTQPVLNYIMGNQRRRRLGVGV